MLSILIPIYNQDATKLVSKLINQCEAADIEYLISVYDDKSTRKWIKLNEPLHHIFKVNYVELSENLGRSKIRNWLASAAPHANLLFLDGDSGIVDDQFISNYVKEIKKGYDVVYGGTSYSKKPCRSKKRRLHWKYGKTTEALPAKKRAENPAITFHSNNFLIKGKIIEQIKFDEKINGYGYEDILLADKITEAGYSIRHINNPVQHLGLETNEDYLVKAEEAVHNLVKLQKQGLLSDTRLSLYYKKLERYHLSGLIPWLYSKTQSKIKNKLFAEDPDIRALQLQKLYWYHQALKSHS